ncbi:MAG: YcaO cyclodehydratase, ATP-ad Mg2+-binding [Labilithrix sp.]|nr:YcaO cyclodehydratase, ATP-ad Mg2+-binding [Labilithrix sp.]
MAASVSLQSAKSSSRPRLPEGWSDPESVEDVIAADGLSIQRAGVASIAPDGEEITGSAAALVLSTARSADVLDEACAPSTKAWFELLERASVVEALRSTSARYELRTFAGTSARIAARRELFPESDLPASWRHARSNGVAIHSGWRRACERASWELAERDRILASWHGHVRPDRIEVGSLGLETASYEWSAWSFPEERPGSFSSGIEVVGVFGFPTMPDIPLALGFAARPDRAAALDDATREATQLLGFLWGEPVVEPSTDVPPTAFGHLDFHQPRERHRLLRSWLAGEHTQYAHLDPQAPPRDREREAEVLYADLTPAWLEGDLRVVKAFCASARPLAFGDAPFGAHLPEERRIHPIS